MGCNYRGAFLSSSRALTKSRRHFDSYTVVIIMSMYITPTGFMLCIYIYINITFAVSPFIVYSVGVAMYSGII